MPAVWKRNGAKFLLYADHQRWGIPVHRQSVPSEVGAGRNDSKYVTRVARCIDNDPMEGFWDILKRERYYGRRFTSKQDLIQMIERYIRYYPTRRVQRNLGMMTP